MGFMKRRAAREEQEGREAGYLPDGGRHPPRFWPEQRMLDWPECRIELRCGCGVVTLYPTKLLAARHGNRSFGEVLGRVRCKECKGRPVAAWLCAGHRSRNGGAPADWAIELIQPGER